MERLILAAQFASQGKLDSLRTLFASDREYFILGDPFSPHSVWSILLLLVPETLDPAGYEPLVRDILSDGLENDAKGIEIGDNEFSVNLPESQIQLRVSRLLGELRLLAEEYQWNRNEVKDNDPEGAALSKFIPNSVYSHWLKCRLRSIDSCCGKLDWFIPLLRYAPEDIQDWYYGIVNVVNQYRVLYSNTSMFTLSEFESNSPEENVSQLLSSTSISHINRDFEKLIVPYISYLNQWDNSLNEWISKKVDEKNFELLVPISEVNQSSILEKPLLTACYLNPFFDSRNFEIIRNIHQGIFISLKTRREGLEHEETDVKSSLEPYTFKTLLQSSRTNPNKQSLDLLLQTVNACEILSSGGFPANIQFVVNLQTNSSPQEEEELVVKYLKNPLKKSWRTLKNELQSLKSNCYLLNHIDEDWIDKKIISGALQSADFDFIKQVYKESELLPPLTLDELYIYYDAGDMRNALNCLQTLEHSIEKTNTTLISPPSSLINATLEISKYEGVSFSPVELKSKHPIEIIEKILSTNQLSYRELPALTKIAERLAIASGLTATDNEAIPVQIRAKCVSYALVNDNFKVAYDYCVPQLTSLKSNIAWTSCYQVGKYVSPFWDYPPISILEQQLKILSYTLKICPKENITTVLSTWKKNDLLYQELLQESHLKKNHTHNAATPAAYSSLSASRIAKAISSSAAEFSSSAQEPSARRQQISSLFVNGLGWAIGANQQ